MTSHLLCIENGSREVWSLVGLASYAPPASYTPWIYEFRYWK